MQGRKVMKRKILSLGIIFLFIGMSIVSCVAICSAKSDKYYFENVNVVVMGRCRTIGSNGTWLKGLFIGTQPYPDIAIGDTRFEGVRIKIFNESIMTPWISLSGLINTDIYMCNATGIFFWGSWTQYSLKLRPPIVFVSCHAEKIWIRY
jgi:hypothetical protein